MEAPDGFGLREGIEGLDAAPVQAEAQLPEPAGLAPVAVEVCGLVVGRVVFAASEADLDDVVESA